MKSSQPPFAATWLLNHLDSSPTNDSLMGDLIEEYRQGRSRIWYWRQVVVAIVVSFGREIRAHSLLALRSVALGWAVILLYRFLFRAPAEQLFVRLEDGLPLGHELIHWSALQVYWYLIWTPVLAIAGWTVAKLHRQHRVAMVLAFAVSKVFTFIPHFVIFATHSFSDPTYLRYTANELWAMVSTTAMIFLGGIWSVSTAGPNGMGASSMLLKK